MAAWSFFQPQFPASFPPPCPPPPICRTFSQCCGAPKLVFYKDGAPQWLFRRGRGRGGAWDHHHGHAGRHRWDIFSFSGVGRSASGAESSLGRLKFSIIIINGCCQLVSIQFSATRFISAQCTSNQSNPIFSNQSSSIFNPIQSAEEVVQSTSIQLRFSFLCLPKLKSSFVAEQRAFPSHEK